MGFPGSCPVGSCKCHLCKNSPHHGKMKSFLNIVSFALCSPDSGNICVVNFPLGTQLLGIVRGLKWMINACFG